MLSIQYGLRYSSFEIPEQADLNASFANKFGFPNNATIDSSTLQPRFSFDMDVSDVWFGDSDKIISANFSGGYGLFTGRLPKVFFSNAFGRSSTTTFFTRGLTDCAGPIPNLTSGAVTGVLIQDFGGQEVMLQRVQQKSHQMLIMDLLILMILILKCLLNIEVI